MAVIALRRGLVGFALVLLLSACATGSRLHANHVPPGSLRVAQAVHTVKGEEVLRPDEREVHETLSQGGLTDAEIRQGTIVFARVVCCGMSERENLIAFFAPATIDVSVGDVVEVRAGRAGDAKAINVATRIREKGGSAAICRWTPDDPRLAARVLYCNGMREEGWVQQSGLWKF
jgi:hypothetical protein